MKKIKEIRQDEIVLFENGEMRIEVQVSPNEETVWLNREQLSLLFKTDRSVISRHIQQIYKSEELDYESTCAFFAHVPETRNRAYKTEYFNLDMVLSIGYKVNAKQGIAFRKWANQILKQYLLSGVAINQKRIDQLQTVVQIMKRTQPILDTNQVLNVIEHYSKALNLLDAYDYHRMPKPQGNPAVYRLTYEECRDLVDQMRFRHTSDLFGREKDSSFQSSINTIYQTFDNQDLYPTVEEKAANLLYLITKNHSFVDGNKRIAAAIFLYFLEKNGALFVNQKKKFDNNALVAITLLIAVSNPREKEVMINLVMNFLTGDET